MTDREQRLTPKQEMYCQYRHAGKTQAQAYKLAYDVENSKESTIAGNACRLEADSKIVARLAELQVQSLERLQITPDFVIGGLAREAMTAKEGSARVAAWRELKNYLGMDTSAPVTIDKKERAELEKEFEDEFGMSWETFQAMREGKGETLQ